MCNGGSEVNLSNNPNLITQDFGAFCTNNVGNCDANCKSNSLSPWSEWIAQVQLNTLNNASEKTRADRYVVGYSDWKDKSTTLSRGQAYPLSITPGLSWSGYQTNLFFRAWIDFNRNGIYEDTELILEKNSLSSAVNQSITISATAVLGTTTMRVSMKKDAYPTACETFAAGEVEDYSVVIQAAGVDPCATDVTPPVLTNCPINIPLTTTGTTAVATWTAPTATDNCVTPSVSSTYNSGFAFPIGSTTVVYTATDAKNNTVTCRFNINVVSQLPNLPDLVLTNLTIPDTVVQQGQNMNYNVMILNNGTASIASDLILSSYISSNPNLSSTDIIGGGIIIKKQPE